jgi:hypothetical protein
MAAVKGQDEEYGRLQSLQSHQSHQSTAVVPKGLKSTAAEFVPKITAAEFVPKITAAEFVPKSTAQAKTELTLFDKLEKLITQQEENLKDIREMNPILQFLGENIDINSNTVIVDYTNLEALARVGIQHHTYDVSEDVMDHLNDQFPNNDLNKIDFKVPIIWLLKYIYSIPKKRIKNLVLVTKRNKWLNCDIQSVKNGTPLKSDNIHTEMDEKERVPKGPQVEYDVLNLQELANSLNILVLNTQGLTSIVYGKDAKRGVDKGVDKDAIKRANETYHDMFSEDDGMCALTYFALLSYEKSQSIVITNDLKLLTQDYSRVPAFSVKYRSFKEGMQERGQEQRGEFRLRLGPLIDEYRRSKKANDDDVVPITAERINELYFQPGQEKNFLVMNSTIPGKKDTVYLNRDTAPEDSVKYFNKYLKYKTKYLEFKSRYN